MRPRFVNPIAQYWSAPVRPRQARREWIEAPLTVDGPREVWGGVLVGVLGIVAAAGFAAVTGAL